MKKGLLLIVPALALLLSACTKRVTEEVRMNTKVIDMEINQNEWSYSNVDNNNYFYASFNVPELTWDIYNYGIVKIYREYNNGTENASQVELPYVRLNEVAVQVDESTTQWVFYTETVDYEFTKGSVTFFYTASDFDYELNPAYVPDKMHFRMIMMW